MIRLIFTLVVLTTTQIAAQSTRLNADAKGILYSKEKALDARIHTHGWAANYMMGDIKSYYKTTDMKICEAMLKSYIDGVPSSNRPFVLDSFIVANNSDAKKHAG